jgi:cytosine/adenosine deaminase-related metal-dependent hydrolase
MMPLQEWLNKYTFPRESAFKDVAYAQDAYSKAVARTLRHGTTTACYYGTIRTFDYFFLSIVEIVTYSFILSYLISFFSLTL